MIANTSSRIECSRLKNSIGKLAIIPLIIACAISQSNNLAAEEQAEEQRVVVTGSRIRQSQAAGSSPIFTLSREDLKKTGLTSVADILQKMSTSGAALNTRFNSSGNFGMPSDGGGVGAGGAEVDMRHLGSDRVLVLVDGKRWVNGSSASGVSGAVDLNTIPLSIVDRIEVLEDGASTIYGSDAIAGVVNVITRKEFDGWEINQSYGGFGDFITGLDDGETSSFELTFGAVGERHNIVTSISHVDQNVVFSRDRSMADSPLAGTGNTRGSSATPYGRFVWIEPQSTNNYGGLCSFIDTDEDNINDSTLCSVTPNGAAASTGTLDLLTDFHGFTNDDRFNYAAYNLYVTPSERTNIYTRASYDLSNSVRFVTQAMYNLRKSKNQAAPEPIFIGPDAGTGGIADTVSIDVTNPYNPFSMTLDSSNFIFAGRRPVEAGPREYFQNVNTSYISTAFDGSFDISGAAYYWDVGMSWGTNYASQIKTGALNAARIKKALGPITECNADPLCVPLDIFGLNAITPEMLNYIMFEQKDVSENKVQLFSANISGDLFELPGGYAGFASGYEHRVQTGYFSPDPVASSGETMGIPSSPTDGGFTADEYFVEAKFPLLEGKKGAEFLELTTALRRSDYKTTANTKFDATTSKLGILWRPMPELSIRASLSEGFRAPSIGELFNTGARNDATLTDPCGNASNHTACSNIWTEPNFTNYTQANGQISVTTGGNVNLQPEESESFVWGAVYSPDWIENASLGFELTFYEHEIKNAIQAIDAQRQLNDCVSGAKPEYCDAISRTNNGTINGFDNGLQNIGKIETSGTDLKVNYSTELDWGRISVVWRNTFVNEYIEYDIDGIPSGDMDGIEFGSNPDRAIPEWKYDLTFGWNKDDWSASTTLRYISKIWEKCSDFLDGSPNSLTQLGLCSNPNANDDSASYNIMDPTYYVDMQVGYSMKWGEYDVDLALGARNLFDQDPPLCTQCDLNGYLPGIYDPQGRNWYIKFSMRP